MNEYEQSIHISPLYLLNPTKKCLRTSICTGILLYALFADAIDIAISSTDSSLMSFVTLFFYKHQLHEFRECFEWFNMQMSTVFQNHGKTSSHRPELVLNNFNTRLGHSVGRLLAALFPYDPQFQGRRCITFHNQRDFIFFRHHR